MFAGMSALSAALARCVAAFLWCCLPAVHGDLNASCPLVIHQALCTGATLALPAIQFAVAPCLRWNVNIHILTIFWISRDIYERATFKHKATTAGCGGGCSFH
jgi:hypothetical protein